MNYMPSELHDSLPDILTATKKKMTPISQLPVLAPAPAPAPKCVTLTTSTCNGGTAAAGSTTLVFGLTETVICEMNETMNRCHGDVEAEIGEMVASVERIVRTVPVGWLSELPITQPPTAPDLHFHLTIYMALMSRLALKVEWSYDDERLFSRMWFTLFKMQRLIAPLTAARYFPVPPLPPRACALLYSERSQKTWDPLYVWQSQGVCSKLFDRLCTIVEIPGGLEMPTLDIDW